MNETIKSKAIIIINRSVLCVLGIFCYLYSIYGGDFAELNIQLPALDFPIFIGEILLAFCITMLLLQTKILSIESKRWHCLLFFYIAFFLSKAFCGYFIGRWGPLAFRDAALFYYPLFAVVGYYFYDRRIFRNNLLHISLFIFLLMTILCIRLTSYALFVYLALIPLLAIKCKPRILKYSFIAIFAFVFPYEGIFRTSRTILIAHFAGITAFLILFLLILKMKSKYKISLAAVIIIGIILGMFHYACRYSIKSMMAGKEFMDVYKMYDDYISKESKDFVYPDYDISLYSRPDIYDNEESRIGKILPKRLPTKYSLGKEKNTGLSPTQETWKPYPKFERKGTSSQLENSRRNIYFRLFVWRDLFSELLDKKPFFGFDFGKPFRSKSIEILNWASAWRMDGWIATHNSYFNLIYRAGIVGIGMIFILFYLISRILRFIIVYKSSTGAFLLSILVFWLVMPCGLVILELPYSAVLFWSLLGMTLRYCRIGEGS